MNLLISNLIQLFTMIFWVVNEGDRASLTIYHSSVMVSLAFRMCIAVERYKYLTAIMFRVILTISSSQRSQKVYSVLCCRCLVITCPQLHCIRQIKASVLLCVAIWVACIITFPLPLFFYENLFYSTFGILPVFVFIICLAGTLRFLLKDPSDATSVPSEEKQRVIGVLVLLLLNYTVTILPIFVVMILGTFYLFIQPTAFIVIKSLFLLSPFVDLFLFAFMCKRLFKKLQKCLCSCRKENNAADEGNRTPA